MTDTKQYIKRFSSRESARRYGKNLRLAKDCLKVKSQVRMLKDLSHRFANRVGNVATLKVGEDPGGEIYLFEDGFFRHNYRDGL